MAFHEVQWYDRNAESLVGEFIADAVAPHGDTSRIVYTCPKDRQAMVELLTCRVKRRGAAGVTENAESYWNFTPVGKIANRILRAVIITNVVGDKDSQAIGGTITMFEGDVLEGWTYNGDTTGECDHDLSYKITEFDAYLYHAPPKTRPEPLVDVQEAGPKPDPVM